MRWGFALCLIASQAAAEVPSATTATYGDWTLACRADAAGAKACEISTRLSVKGQDGQLRPLLALAVSGQVLRLQLPDGLDLRAGLRLDAAEAKDSEPLARPVFVTCAAAACLAETPATEGLVAHMTAAPSMEVRFVTMAETREIRVPVTLKGFGDAHRAMVAAMADQGG